MPTYRPPTEEQVKEAIRRIPTPQLRRAFFENLKNPLWVEPLDVQGAFSQVPEPEPTNDGLIRDTYWPEIDYLGRVASEVPTQVVNVLLKLTKSTNAWVRRSVFSIGATIPPAEAARLQPLIKSWLATGFGWRTDPRDLVSYAVNLLSGGESNVGRWFANVIFRPSKTTKDQAHTLVLDDYWYEHELPRLVSVLGPDGLQVVLPWLVAYERQIGHFTDESDFTYFSRDSIRRRNEHHDGVEQALIDAVRDLAVEATIADASAATELLLKSKMLVARKIAMFAVSAALGTAPGEAVRRDLLTAAHELLFEGASFDDSCRIDYAELARAVSNTTEVPLDSLEQMIELGPRVDHDRLREWLRHDESDDTELDARVKEYVGRWKHQWLSAIGIDALPQVLRDELADLDAQFGVIDAPLEPAVRVSGWVGPSSPVTQDDMAMMSVAELVAHLETWHPTGQGWGPDPTHEGQGRELSALLTTNPAAIAGTDNLVSRLRPTYVRAILRGWEAALKAGQHLDWSQVGDTIAEVLAHSGVSSFAAEGSNFDDDPDMHACKHAAVGLLEELVKKRPSVATPAGVIERFAELLIVSAADTRAWAEYSEYEGDSGMDPLTTSLNWQWPEMLRGLIHLMSWGTETDWYDTARSLVERELARSDARGASRAVLGEALGRLLDAVPEWVAARSPEFFGEGSHLTIPQQIALTTATAVHHYHHRLFQLLSPSMVAAMNSEQPIVAGWRSQSDPIEQIGQWAIQSVIRGHGTLDDPVARTFFAAAPPAVRGRAIGQIAWAFMHASAVDDSFRDRFAALWDRRVEHVRESPGDEEELNGFHWFVRSHKFAVQWWLTRLQEALKLHRSLGAERGMIGKEVAAAAEVDPRGAFDVLKLLLETRNEHGLGTFDLARNAIPMVIARAIASGDATLESEATNYMNQLGEEGNLALEAEVNKVLLGVLTQDDVDE